MEAVTWTRVVTTVLLLALLQRPWMMVCGSALVCYWPVLHALIACLYQLLSGPKSETTEKIPVSSFSHSLSEETTLLMSYCICLS